MIRFIATARRTLVCFSSALGNRRSANTLPELPATSSFLLFLFAMPRLGVMFCTHHELSHFWDMPSILSSWQLQECAGNDSRPYRFPETAGVGSTAMAGPFVPSPLSMTDCSGSIQNAQMAAPTKSSPADTTKGATQDPFDTRIPKTVGDSAPTICPPIFIMPDTVPENSPPMSMGTAHAGPIVISRKNIALARQ